MNKTIYVVSTKKYFGPGYFFNASNEVKVTDNDGEHSYYKLYEQSENEEVVVYGHLCPIGLAPDIQARINDYCPFIEEEIDETVRLVFLLHDKDIKSGNHPHFRYNDENTKLNVKGREIAASEMKIYGYSHHNSSYFGNFLDKFKEDSALEFHHRLERLMNMYDFFSALTKCQDKSELVNLISSNQELLSKANVYDTLMSRISSDGESMFDDVEYDVRKVCYELGDLNFKIV